MIYNKNVQDDLINKLRHINSFTKSIGISGIHINVRQCEEVLIGMRKEFPYVKGMDNSSTFKKVANFVAFFIAISPIKSTFPESVAGKLFKYNPNAILALDIAIVCIENSTIYREETENVCIDKPIIISDHSYYDILSALSIKGDGGVKPISHQPLLALFFEQLVYKTNSHCEYSKEDVNYYANSMYQSWICKECGSENTPMDSLCEKCNIKP
jgi:ribosomal protein L40E